MKAADETKLDGIETSADVTDQANVYSAATDILVAGMNVTLTEDDTAQTITVNATGGGMNTPTNLGIANRDTDSLDVTSSSGTNVTIESATTTLAGLQSAADKTKLNGIATGATANTGDITAVSTGNNSGLAGGDSDGAVNLRLDFENLATFGTFNFSDDDDIVPLYNDDNGAAVGVTLGQFKAEIGAGAATTPPVVLATDTEVRFRHTSDLDSDNIYAGDGEIEFSQALDSGDDNAVIYIDGTIETVLSGSAPSFTDSTGDAQSWTVGTAITDIVLPEAIGDPTPTYAVVGLLPAGLDFEMATRTISGTPSAVASGTIIIQAINSEGAANWSIDYATTAPSGITRETIPTKSGEVVRALITVGEATVQGNNGSGKWYSRHGSENIGSVAGSLAITNGLTISRVWSPGGNEDDDFRLNQQGGDSLAEWVWGADNLTNGRFEEGDTASPPFGAGYDKAVFLSFDSGGTTQMIELGFRDDFRNTGGGWYNLEFSDAQDALADAVAVDALVNMVIADRSDVLFAPVFADSTGDAQSWTIGAPIVNIVVPEARGNPTPTYSTVGTLPSGLQFDPTSRRLSGTPNAVGSGTITIRATNSQGTADWTIGYTVNAEILDTGSFTLASDSPFHFGSFRAKLLRDITDTPTPMPNFTDAGEDNLRLQDAPKVLNLTVPTNSGIAEVNRWLLFYSGKTIGRLSSEHTASDTTLQFDTGADFTGLSTGDTIFINQSPDGDSTAVEEATVTNIDTTNRILTVTRGSNAATLSEYAGVAMDDDRTYGLTAFREEANKTVTLDFTLVP